MFKAILWDNDGVLVDTEALYYRATRHVLAGLGVELSESQYIDLFLREARGAWHLVEGLTADEVLALRKRRDDLYGSFLDAGTPPIPGVADTVRRLARHHRMAIVTSSEHFDRIHRDPTFLRLFEFILTPAQYQRCKPHPEPYLRAVERMRLRPEECLVVEDSERGLRAAKAAGLACWVIPSGFTCGGSFDGADRVLGSAAEMEALLER